MQLDYHNPNFDLIKMRIEDRIPVTSTYRSIGDKDFSDLSSIEIMALIWFYINFLKVCSLEDLVFCFNSAFGAHASKEKIKQILSVLVGAGIAVREGPLGLVRIADATIRLAEPSVAKQKTLQALQLELTALVEGQCDANYLEAMAHAA